MSITPVTSSPDKYPYNGVASATAEAKLHPETYTSSTWYVLGHPGFDRYINLSVTAEEVLELGEGTIVLNINPKYYTPSNPPMVVGKVFAGWYSDEECKHPMHMIGQGSSYEDATLYARFVDEKILSVKTAIKPGRSCLSSDGKNHTLNMDLLTSVPKDTDFADVGFAFTIGNLPPHWHIQDDPRTVMVPPIEMSKITDRNHKPMVELVTSYSAYSGLEYKPNAFHTTNSKLIALAHVPVPLCTLDSMLRVAAWAVTKDGSRVFGPISSVDIHKRLNWDEWNGMPVDPTEDDPMVYHPKITFEAIPRDLQVGNMMQPVFTVYAGGDCKGVLELKADITFTGATREPVVIKIQEPEIKANEKRRWTPMLPALEDCQETVTVTCKGSYMLPGEEEPIELSVEDITFNVQKD